MLFLLFQLGADRYALEASQVVEVLPLLALKALPGAARGVAGLLDYRGTTVPVVDLSAITLGKSAVQRVSTRLLVVNYPTQTGETRLLGLLAEHTTETVKRDPADFRSTGVANDGAPYLGPVAHDPRGLIQRIEISALLSTELRAALFPPIRHLGGYGMNIAEVEIWLRDYAGLDANALGPGVLGRVVQNRLEQLGCSDAAAYVERLLTSATERQTLIDRVIVAETWFFRDRVAVDTVARHALETWSPAHPGSTFRVLCVPCSTGEEPYSIAMAFAEAGWPSERLQIDAIDIGGENIRRAREGVYRKNSFRSDDLLFRDTSFDLVSPETWSIQPALRRPITFNVGNLLAPDFLSGRGRYDAIFCRNLLIYFDREIQLRVVATLGALLAPEGMLAVGPAEPVLFFEQGYSAVKVPNSFLLRRDVPRSAPLEFVVPKAPRVSPPRPPLPRPFPAPLAKLVTPAVPPAPDTEESIQRLADAGKLREASERGAALLAGGAPTPGLLYLLGVVADATGDATRAEALYRKALYLAPDHRAALAQLALHAEKRGDFAQSQTLQNRLRRAEAPAPGTKPLEAAR